jgi:hypothetical protein
MSTWLGGVLHRGLRGPARAARRGRSRSGGGGGGGGAGGGERGRRGSAPAEHPNTARTRPETPGPVPGVLCDLHTHSRAISLVLAPHQDWARCRPQTVVWVFVFGCLNFEADCLFYLQPPRDGLPASRVSSGWPSMRSAKWASSVFKNMQPPIHPGGYQPECESETKTACFEARCLKPPLASLKGPMLLSEAVSWLEADRKNVSAFLLG